jgi:hypothetical protein
VLVEVNWIAGEVHGLRGPGISAWARKEAKVSSATWLRLIEHSFRPSLLWPLRRWPPAGWVLRPGSGGIRRTSYGGRLARIFVIALGSLLSCCKEGQHLLRSLWKGGGSPGASSYVKVSAVKALREGFLREKEALRTRRPAPVL